MRKAPTITVLTLAALTIAGGAFAQPANPAAGAATTTPATPSASVAIPPATSGMAPGMVSRDPNSGTPSERNPILTDAGNARASKVIGSSVYNDHNDKIGSINDLVITKDGTIQAILSVGGFLGMGTKYVAVPYNNLKFGNTNVSSANRVVLAGATKDSLKNMGSFTYTHS